MTGAGDAEFDIVVELLNILYSKRKFAILRGVLLFSCSNVCRVVKSESL